MIRGRFPALAVTAAICVLALAPSSALATTQTAAAGPVSATFSFTFHPAVNDYTGLRLKITRAGATAYDQAVASRFCASPFCWPGAPPQGHSSSVQVRDLDPGGELEVLLELYSGGAHCCVIEQVFSFDSAASTYLKTERNFGDYGAALKDLRHDGVLDFVSGDDSFAYAFTDFADSGLPIQILTFHARRFVNVTRHFPKLIARDAAHWLRAFKANLANGVGFIAAWAADEELLGHSKLVKDTLARELKAGHLRGTFESGSRFVRDLNRFLRRRHYLP
jgi:hypothetical protein